MERVGHSNAKMTLEIYSHTTEDMEDKLVNNWILFFNFAPRLPLFNFTTQQNPLKTLIIQGVVLYHYNSSAILFIFLSLWLTPLLVMGFVRLSANCWIE